MTKVYSWFGGRKMFLAVCSAVASIVLCAVGRMTGGECVTALLGIVGLYGGVNVAQKRSQPVAGTEAGGPVACQCVPVRRPGEDR